MRNGRLARWGAVIIGGVLVMAALQALVAWIVF